MVSIRIARFVTKMWAWKADSSQAFGVSGGEQQRVGDRAFIINEPKILLRTSLRKLDSKNSEIVLQMLPPTNQGSRSDRMMITHNPEAVTYFDRVVQWGRVIVDAFPRIGWPD